MGSYEPRKDSRIKRSPAGKFSAWLRSFLDSRTGETTGSNVPCGDCNACCRSSLLIRIRPEDQEALKRIPQEFLAPIPGLPEGNALMGPTSKGLCPMLVENRCTIYEHRPRTCRDYDCRVFAATATSPSHSAQHLIAEKVRDWRFDYPESIDREEQSAVFAAAAVLKARGTPSQSSQSGRPYQPSAIPANHAELAIEAVARHKEIYESLFGVNS
jgi:uncharacterized protein